MSKAAICVVVPVYKAMATLDPVSYTHLDVYKRQIFMRTATAW